MRAAVFGAGGMLGVALIRELERRGVEVRPWPHAIVDITNAKDVDSTFMLEQPDVVFNAAGVLNTSHDYPAMIRANALGPHVLAQAARVYGVPVIHVSTDCVFSGFPSWSRSPRQGYSVARRADPTDLYGRTKLVGEVLQSHVTNVRTSFVGPDHGLWAWLVEQAEAGAKVEGWTRAWWSGSTVWAVASGLVDLVDVEAGRSEAMRSHGYVGRPPPGGILHLATEKPITKLDALETMRDGLDLHVELVETDHVRIDRSLAPTHVLPSLEWALGVRP